MKKLLLTIDRWAPALISILTLFLVCVFGWWYSARQARVEGHVVALQNQLNLQMQSENQIRSEFAAVSKWMIAVHERGSAAGWKLPDIPISPVDKPKDKPKPQTKK